MSAYTFSPVLVVVMAALSAASSTDMSSGSLKVEFIADTMCPPARKVKELLGITPIDYINQQRPSHAEHLLLSTSLSIKEIMYDCGFSQKEPSDSFRKVISSRFHNPHSISDG